MTMSETWVVACQGDALAEGEPVSVTIDGVEIALYRVGDIAFATDGVCTHGSAQLCDGFQEGYEIECPLHQGRFDIRNGKALCEPLVEDIRTYPAKIENGNILVKMR